MKWSNLKINKCPQCNKDLADASYNPNKKMLNCRCGFSITEARMQEIVSNKVERELEREEPQYEA